MMVQGIPKQASKFIPPVLDDTMAGGDELAVEITSGTPGHLALVGSFNHNGKDRLFVAERRDAALRISRKTASDGSV